MAMATRFTVRRYGRLASAVLSIIFVDS